MRTQDTDRTDSGQSRGEAFNAVVHRRTRLVVINQGTLPFDLPSPEH
jgi:hypothetical protein